MPYNADHVWDGTAYEGVSLGALETLGMQIGYKLIACESRGVNVFFVRHNCVKSLKPIVGSTFLRNDSLTENTKSVYRSPKFAGIWFGHPPSRSSLMPTPMESLAKRLNKDQPSIQWVKTPPSLVSCYVQFWLAVQLDNRSHHTLTSHPPFPAHLAYRWLDSVTDDPVETIIQRTPLTPALVRWHSTWYPFAL
jgi:hypothetical protein